MSLRKCQIYGAFNRPDPLVCYFHKWVTKEDGSTYAIVEKAETGQVIPWSEDLDFLEPARQRVEVTPYGKPPITGYLVGWYQYQDEDQAGPVALVRHDDRTFDTYSPRQVQIIEEVPNGQ